MGDDELIKKAWEADERGELDGWLVNLPDEEREQVTRAMKERTSSSFDSFPI